MYKRMSDQQLVFAEKQILIRMAQLRPAISPYSQRLLAEHQSKLDHLHAEQQRRLTP